MIFRQNLSSEDISSEILFYSVLCCKFNKIYNVWLRKRIIRVLTKEVALGCHMLNAE